MIDLHCHTSISDSSMRIGEVIQTAKEIGVTHLAITDHDTTKGLERAQQMGSEQGLTVIPGIEISAYDFLRERKVHILGFYVQPGHQAIQEVCDPVIASRQTASFQMVERLKKEGYVISWEQVERFVQDGDGTCVYKQHIMHALIENGYTHQIYGELYCRLFSSAINQAGLAYIPMKYASVYDAIQAIHQSGGVPVLAHPEQYNSYEGIPEWVDAGLRGIEWKHPLHNGKVENKVLEIAEKYGLIKTGGSDWHGEYGGKESWPIGSKSPGIKSVEDLLQACQERGRG